MSPINLRAPSADKDPVPLLRLASLLAAAALAFAAVASGALTPSAYRAHANGACAKAHAQLNSLGQLKQTATNADFAKLLTAAVAISWHEYTSLRALHPPASLLAAHRRALWALWHINVAAADELRQVQGGTDWMKVALTGSSSTDSLSSELHDAWTAAGVTVCANDS
jgi:hypothetical protein